MNSLKRAACVSLAVAAVTAATACSTGGGATAPAKVAAAERSAPATAAPATINAAAESVKKAGTSSTTSGTAKGAARAKLGIADITPMGEKTEKVGVGFPIIVVFDRKVADRAATEAALQVEAEKPVDGAWRWVSDRKVVYRTKTYWKPHQKVTFTAHLSQIPGNEAAKDVSRRFAVGTANVSLVDTRKHVMKVRRDGKLVKTIPISAGRGGLIRNGVDVYLTTSGVHLAMGKKPVETMTSSWMGVTDPKDPLYYKLEIPWAVRISDSGEYVHQSAGDYQFLGKSNQSHGCVRATPAGAKWFYGISQRGDVVQITGTKRKLDWRNGWSFWQLNWTEWKKGSALNGKTVMQAT
ncbi:L,D-transpeptidase [Microbispora sp. RL4-1S]|uniref:L,D-transpeptidase n=1 Tax=Microbispora oryzae TaxID=2806554 RepID=A0A941ALI7_9ACTN|nr:L,D-transpeptidase [Microbispora oryzae]MBP2708655.1 L,D-transpeptidase [Microbispora oryzae]